MAQLVFEIKDQWISRTDTFKPVAKSKNYLYAQFNFLTDEWVGVPTAIFRNKTSAYEQIIGQDGTCLVPWEVIDVEGDSEIFVSVFCGDLVTANKARVHVYDTGYGDDLESDTPPTPSVYEQILNRMYDIEEDMDDATRRAETAAENAEEASAHYPVIMEDYWYVWDVIEREYVNTDIKAAGYDGTSATVEVEQFVGGHRVVITDVSGEHVFDVSDGRDGTDGRGIASLEKTSTSGDVDQYTMTFSDGSEPFIYYVTNGASATISTRAITNGYRLTITDKNGTRAIDVLNGAKGDPGNGIQSINKIGSYENYDYYEIRMTNGNKTSFTVTNGYSPTVSTVSLTGGHRVIITDANGSHSFDVMDGNGITNTVLNSDYTLTITFTDGTSYTTPSIRGAKGDTGNGIQSIAKTSTSGLVDTYTITYTNGQTTTFDVTNGETPTVDAGDIAYDDTETYSEGTVGDGLGDLKAEISQLQTGKADIIISNASGTMARFPDGAEYDAVGLTAEFAPYQEGTGDPSPTNVRPIHRWTGLDIIRNNNSLVHPDDKENPMEYYGKNSTNVVQYNSTENAFIVGGGTAGLAYAKHSTPNITALNESRYFIAPADMTVTVYVEYKNIGTDFGIRTYKDLNHQGDIHGTADNTWHQGTKTISLLKGEGIRILMYPNIYWKNLALYYGSTATPYEPYNGTTTTISWQTEAGEVFGGYVDAVSGKLVVDWVCVDLGDLAWQTYGTSDHARFGSTGIASDIVVPSADNVKAEIMCDVYTIDTATNVYNHVTDKRISVSINGNIYCYDTAYSTPSDFKAAVDGTQLVYKLATPIEYDIDPVTIELLKGYNNVWTSAGGNVDVTYKADTKLYIDGKQLDIRNTIAPIEDGATASQAYTTGKFFYRNGSFCKAKTAIASGAAFTLGTNYEVTTVAAELFTALS